jgi:hypothetical protein
MGKNQRAMDLQDLKKLERRIKTIRKGAEELTALGSSFPAVERNAKRILATVKMLEINVSDLVPHVPHLKVGRCSMGKEGR